jgi:hypothetical protein
MGTRIATRFGVSDDDFFYLETIPRITMQTDLAAYLHWVAGCVLVDTAHGNGKCIAIYRFRERRNRVEGICLSESRNFLCVQFAYLPLK